MENEQRIATVVAIEISECLVLERKLLRHVLDRVPELYRKIRLNVFENINQYKKPKSEGPVTS